MSGKDGNLVLEKRIQNDRNGKENYYVKGYKSDRSGTRRTGG